MGNWGNMLSRILIAGGIALVGWIVYMWQVEENPVTGQKQHVSLSPAQEIRLGLESAPHMSQKMGGEIPQSDPRTRVVQKMGKFLVEQTLAKKSPWNFQFHLLSDAQSVNAFALPGGQIFITLGLLEKLSNEAELAGVLGHEMGHVIERHTAEQMAKNQLGNTMVIAVGAAASDQGRSPYMIAAFVNQVIQLRYGRHDESEADSWGIRLMEEAKFNPEALIKVMQILKAQSRGGGLAIFQTHPNPDLRIKDIQAYLAKHPPPPEMSDGRPLEELYRLE
jgi:predicted Zn-dependent protease